MKQRPPTMSSTMCSTLRAITRLQTFLLLILSLVLTTATTEATPNQEQPPTSSSKDSTQELIQHLLNQDLGTRKFSFPDVVLAASGKKVIPIDLKSSSHQAILKVIEQSAQQVILEFNQADSPIRKLRRINEASRYFEDSLLKKINAHAGFSSEIPQNTQGKKQRSGYPDLLITYTSPTGKITRAYLDPKLFEEKSQASSLRTFYFEPRSRTNKIQYDALHLLLGISHDGHQQKWTFTGWHLCDLFKFQVRLKAEFQASNRDLYRKDLIIRSSQKSSKH